jgi:hypothetical protein
MDDVQIDINELMAAFARENATLTQRAIIAEQKVKAMARALDEARRDKATPDAAAKDE